VFEYCFRHQGTASNPALNPRLWDQELRAYMKHKFLYSNYQILQLAKLMEVKEIREV
jgi:hypothetical protein